MPEKQKQGLEWVKNNLKLTIFIVLLIGGAIASAALILDNVKENTSAMEEVEIRVDTLSKKHTVLNQSFTSYREATEEDLEDMAADIEDIADEQSDAHDLLIRMAERMGVE